MTVLARDDRPIEYLLELKQHNQWDAFHPKYTLWWTLAFALAMVVCTSWQSDDKDIQLSLIFSLALGLLHLMVVWPLQKIFYDSHVVARLLGRQSFEELHVPLGNPRQVVIAIKRFSLMAIFSECGPRVAGGLLLLCLISPAGLTGQGAVFALLTWLIWALAVAIGGSCFSYGAQILHSLKHQLIARAILLLAMLGLLLNIAYGASLAFGLSLDLCSGTFGTDFNSAKLLSGAMLVTLLALALLNRAAVSLCFNRSLEQAVSSRPASRWVIGWGNNPIVFRERRRLAHRVPENLAGSIAWQAPLLTFFPFIAYFSLDTRGSYLLLVYTAAAIQMFRGLNGTRLAVVKEIESQTECLLEGTSLSHNSFILGWMQVICLPLAFESSLLCLLLYLQQVHSNSLNCAFEVKGSLCLLLGAFFGGSLGLYASCAKSRESAETNLSTKLMVNVASFLGILFVRSCPWTEESKALMDELVLVLFLGVVPCTFLASTRRWMRSRRLLA